MPCFEWWSVRGFLPDETHGKMCITAMGPGWSWCKQEEKKTKEHRTKPHNHKMPSPTPKKKKNKTKHILFSVSYKNVFHLLVSELTIIENLSVKQKKTIAYRQLQHRKLQPRRGMYSQVMRAWSHPHTQLTSHRCWCLGCFAFQPLCSPWDGRCTPFCRLSCRVSCGWYHNSTVCNPFLFHITLAAQNCACLFSPDNSCYSIPATGLLLASAKRG